MNKTNIEWCDLSANPLKYRRKSDGAVVWGCVKTSTGCAHCYSEALTLRYQRGKLFNAKNMEELEPFLDPKELHKMLTAKQVGGVPVSGSRCFVGDMTDCFGEWVSDGLLDQLFTVFALRQDVTWQVLTKRPERMEAYFAGYRACGVPTIRCRDMPDGGILIAPLNNVWLGTSVENQAAADERIPHLLRTPAMVRFLSVEPLLGPIDLPLCFHSSDDPNQHDHSQCAPIPNWIIVGGESGPHARPMHPGWARSIRDQCQAAGVPFFFKQHGEWFPSELFDFDTASPVLDGRPELYVGPSGQVTHAASPYEHGCPCSAPPGHESMVRVGKKAAGRLLDGREWSEFPAAAEAR